MVRNRLFTAITRSKAWVRVTGVAPNIGILTQEFQRIRDNNFSLNFRYPTEEERGKLRIVHRELSAREHREVRSSDRSARELLNRLTDGDVHPEDLDPAVREKLLEILGESNA